MTRSPYLVIVLAVSTWGTWPLWLRASMVPGAVAGFWSLVFIGALGLAASRLPALRGRRLRAGDWPWLLGMGFGAAVNQLAYFAAFEWTAVARVAMAHYVAPVLVALLAPWLLRERFQWRVPLALLGAVSGLALLLLERPVGGPVRGDAVGVGLGLLSAGAYAAILLCAKRLSPGLSATWLVGAHCGLGAVLGLPYLLATTTIVATTNELLHLALASLCAGFIPTTFFYWALARVPAQHAAVLTYLEPVVSAALAALVLGERMGAQGVLGAACVLAAGVMVVWRR